MSCPTPCRLAVLASLFAFAVPAAAHAGAVQLYSGTVGSTPVLAALGSADADDLAVTTAAGKITISGNAGTTVSLIAGGDISTRCTPTADATGFSCSTTGLGAGTATSISQAPVVAQLGAGDDRWTVGDSASSGPAVAVDGNDGNDRLSGGRGPDRLDGSAGNDALTGLLGVDWLNGGDGNDFLHMAPTADGAGYASPSDADEPRSSCGSGTDMVLRDQVQDVDQLGTDAGCETDIGTVSNFKVTSSRPNTTWSVGDVLSVTFDSTRSAPTDSGISWRRCTLAPIGGNVSTERCDEVLGTGSEFVVGAALLGLLIRPIQTPVWSVPDNPVVWTGDRQGAGSMEVRDTPRTAAPGPPISIQVTPTDPIAFLDGLRPNGKDPLAMKATGLSLRGPAGSDQVHLVATLSVAPKLLGRKGKSPVVVARGDEQHDGTGPWTLTLNKSGRALRSRLRPTKKVPATLTLWAQSSASKKTSKRTLAVRITRG